MANPSERFRHLDHAHFAVAMCRYWWLTYEDLPRWRIFKRRQALELAQMWGNAAIKASIEDEAEDSEDSS